ncbi:MAG: ABC transporter substrate-binding protein [Rhodospirillaceae bacterium]|jgi:peptide/nickel transport system substrate-binding protein|nr:ABC transporter substrate-binding protein [Rhodospirillaceae bacterium]MBT5241949.1 ABC transporter substrate-binding protein [Rhodospirillaceae bacterium]MBT5567387.1 ABC transporter substrate-binding protein [Rhodospirillaceae bacterium]MBT6089509.1 ABC transporter substrate-binding protein [Rhodospirillaceae bacterium]MBT6961249.1 ABC transporter substrate-binding protein [Rhodospirillaceae bacterium]
MKRAAILFAALLCATASVQAESLLRVGMIAMPPAQGNPFFTTGTTPHMFYPAIYDTLTQVNEQGDVVPQIATSWARINDLTWTFDIRSDAAFSNGEPVNAATVVAMVDAFERDDFIPFSLPREFDFIAGVRALDNDTVEITTTAPHALMPRYMSFFYVVPPQHLADNGAAGLASNPIGTGPYIVEDWLPERVMLRANAKSWRAPKIDRVEALILTQATTRRQALESGRIDVAISLGPDDEPRLSTQGLRLHPRNPVRISVIAMNTMTDGTPFTDVRVRQAMNYAVDTKAITEALMGGYVEPASQPTPANAIGFDPTLEPYPYDPDKARALLNDAGMTDGFDVIFEVVTGANSSTDAVMQQVAADLARINVRVEVRPILYSQVVARMTQGGWDGHMFGVDFATGPTMDGLRPFRLHSCTWSAPWYCDPVAEALYQEAKITADEATRVDLTRQVIKRYRDQASTILLFPILGLDGLGPRVKTWAPVNDRLMLHKAELFAE